MNGEGESTLRGARVLLGVSSSIAAHRALDLASQLRKEGAEVRAVLTPSTVNLIATSAFDAITHQRTVVDLWDEEHAGGMDHLALTKWADLFVVVPATANTLAMLAHGLATNALGTFAAAWNKGPLLIAPAMNPEMWRNRAVQENVRRLLALGHRFAGPVPGDTACDDQGMGRLASVETILEEIRALRRQRLHRPLEGKRVMITAGPTREFADDVRCLTNPSTGRMGIALAGEAAAMGAEVALILGPTTVEAGGPYGALHRVESAEDMLHAALGELPRADVAIFAAAVSDWRPAERFAGKEKKSAGGQEVRLRLVRTPDIAAQCHQKRREGQIFVGFAAESSCLEDYAREKMAQKGFDYIFANAINQEGGGFGTVTNRGLLLSSSGGREEVALSTKQEVARLILETVARDCWPRPVS